MVFYFFITTLPFTFIHNRTTCVCHANGSGIRPNRDRHENLTELNNSNVTTAQSANLVYNVYKYLYRIWISTGIISAIIIYSVNPLEKCLIIL